MLTSYLTPFLINTKENWGSNTEQKLWLSSPKWKTASISRGPVDDDGDGDGDDDGDDDDYGDCGKGDDGEDKIENGVCEAPS